MNELKRPECIAAIEYLRRTGTEAAAAKLAAGLRTIFGKLEHAAERTPVSARARRPAPAAWSVHEIIDHLVETHRPAADELRSLCIGISPTGGPIPARLTSVSPLIRPWPKLIDALQDVHAEILRIVSTADPTIPLTARAPFVMVLKIRGASGTEVVEWIEDLDWKAYAQGIRIHSHEHLAQIERTLSEVARS